jgi:hypothetical protein
MTGDIRQLLVQKLTVKGLETNFTLINKHMRSIGWDDIDLDYHTFELARNCLEDGGFTGDEYKTSKWYKELVFSL